MGLLGLPVPGPGDAVRAATGALNALDQAVTLVPRIATLIGTLEVLAARAEAVIGEVDAVQAAASGVIARTTVVIGAVEEVVGLARGTVDRVGHVVAVAEGTVKRVDDVVTNAAETVDGAQVVVGRTSGVVGDASTIVARTGGVVDGADALLGRSDQLVGRILETTSDEELQAIVHLIDTLPQAVDALRNDVLPVMSTLGTVAPDVRDLLDIASQLNGVLGSVPGLGRIRKRVQKAQAEEDGESYRADDAPPSAPERD